MVNPVDTTPSADASASGSPFPLGLVIGLAVGVSVILIIISVAGVILYKKTISNQKSIWAKQLSMININAINMGDAKSSIVSGVDVTIVITLMDVIDTVQ